MYPKHQDDLPVFVAIDALVIAAGVVFALVGLTLRML